jgi:hypothetical protein
LSLPELADQHPDADRNLEEVQWHTATGDSVAQMQSAVCPHERLSGRYCPYVRCGFVDSEVAVRIVPQGNLYVWLRWGPHRRRREAKSILCMRSRGRWARWLRARPRPAVGPRQEVLFDRAGVHEGGRRDWPRHAIDMGRDCLLRVQNTGPPAARN